MSGTDYRMLPPREQVTILAALFSAFRKPTPRDQISSVLALALGLCGVQPNGTAIEAHTEQDTHDLNAIFDECADAVLDVLARHGATFVEIAA